MKLPLITIIIPTYNSASTIQQVLTSILELEYPKGRLELIFVDCSTDETPYIIERFIKQCRGLFYNIKLIRIPVRCGVSHARNVGILHSHGDYIFFLDSDVILRRGTLNDLLQILHTTKKCGAVSAIYMHASPSLLEEIVMFRYINRVKEGPLFTGAALIPRYIIQQVGLFNERLGYPYTVYEDWEYQVRIQRLGLKTLVDGRNPLLHLSKMQQLSGEAQRFKLNSLKHLMRLFASYFSFSKAFALYEVLRQAPWRLRFEYILYALITPLALAFSLLSPVSIVLLIFVIFTLALLYYLIDCRFRNIRYILIYTSAILISRVARATTLLIYLIYLLLLHSLSRGRSKGHA